MAIAIPLYVQTQAFFVNITPSFTTILSNVTPGKYLMSLSVNSVYSFLVELVLVPGDNAQCTSAANCGMKTDIFYNNVSDCQLLDGTNETFILQFQYLNSNLSVQTIQGGTLSNCLFTLLYLGNTTPTSGTSMVAVDTIQASTGTTVNIVSSLMTNAGRFRNIQTITTNTLLNNTYDIINCNATGSITISLPQTTTATGAEYSFVNNTTNSVSISTFSGDTINGTSSSTSLSSKYATTTLTSLGNSIWYTNI
jgi:hypothetical protein